MRKESGIIIGDTTIFLKKDGQLSRITIVKGSNCSVLNCTNSEMLRFLTDSIDMMMVPNA